MTRETERDGIYKSWRCRGARENARPEDEVVSEMRILSPGVVPPTNTTGAN